MSLSVLLALGSLLIGTLVILRNQKNSTNILFFAICSIGFIWSILFEFTLYIFINKPAISDQQSSLLTLLNEASYVVGMLLMLAIISFTYYFPIKRSKKLLKCFFLPVIVVTIFSATDKIAGKVSIINDKYVISSGKYVWVYLLVMAIGVLILLYNLFSNRHMLGEAQRSQNKLLASGFGISIFMGLLLAVIAPILFPNQTFDVLSPVALLFFIVPVAAAIKSFRLFDIRPIIARSLAYVFSVIVIVALYSLAVFGLVSSFLSVNLSTAQIILFAVFSAITALIFQPVRRFFDKFSNRLFYRDVYDAQELLNRVNSSLVSTTDLRKLLEATAKEMETNIKASFCNFYIDSKTVLEFHAVGTNTALFNGEKWESLLEVLELSKAKIFSEEHGLNEKTSQLMHDLKADVILRLTSQNQNVGYLVVGQKQSGSSFTAQDAQILSIIADEVAIAVQNTLRYEEIALFNVTLQQKIKNATAELQHTNQKLKALDEAKDEFISMASHQLRTPLTSVKGYLSMLLEGDGGKLNDQQRRFLDQAFISSQRMVYLIADLLNVSRLKTGKFVIEAKPTYLPDLVESEIAQLHETALARGLEMIFDKPKEFPTLNLDETKIRQVIMNFADNAIHYTPKGGKITLELKQTDESVEFTVTDTGIGVPKADVHKLFTKFYRAGNARKARPDGTGLGIFMAKKVVAAQDGAIIFKTEEGKGSTFGFTFPRAKLEAKPTEK